MPRDHLDRYYTPLELCESVVPLLGVPHGARVVEPSVGAGAWARALRAEVPGVELIGVDIDPQAGGVEHVDFFMRADWPTAADKLRKGRRVDWVIGNPPYKHAELHLRRALALTKNVAFLLRLGFLSSRRRIPLFADHPPAEVIVLSERPSFTGGGTDASDYAVIVWREGHVGRANLAIHSWASTPTRAAA